MLVNYDFNYFMLLQKYTDNKNEEQRATMDDNLSSMQYIRLLGALIVFFSGKFFDQMPNKWAKMFVIG